MTLPQQTHKDGDLRRARMVAFVAKFVARHGFSPTVREVAMGCGLRSPGSAMPHLRKLAADGVLTFQAGQPRTIRLLSSTNA